MSFLIRGKINKKISRAVDLFDEKNKNHGGLLCSLIKMSIFADVNVQTGNPCGCM